MTGAWTRRPVAGLLLTALLIGSGGGGSARAETPTAPVRPGAASTAATPAPRKPAVLGDARLAAIFRHMPTTWDPARRSDFDFLPRPTMDVTAAMVAAQMLRTEAEAIGDRRMAIAATMILGHLMRIHELPQARDVLEAAIGEASAARWRDGEMRTALHDLAVVTAGTDAARATGLEARAATCPRPCAVDEPTRLYARGLKAARTLGPDEDEPTDEALRRYKFGRTWLRDTFGLASDWYGLHMSTFETVFSQTRPFTTLEILRERFDATTAPAERAEQADQLAAALRIAGDYGAAAERAAEAKAIWTSLGEAGKARLSDYAEIMARQRAGDPGARERLRGLAPSLLADFSGSGSVRDLAKLAGDLVTLRLTAEADPVLAELAERSAGAWGVGQYMKAAALAGRARIASSAGRLDDADGLLDRAIAATPPVEGGGVERLALGLERARLRDAQGRGEEAARLRAEVAAASADFSSDEPANFLLGAMSLLRDLGSTEAAGLVAEIAARSYSDVGERPSYETAQDLWQIAYSLALAGRTEGAFTHMKTAAAIAIRHSFESVDDTDGGSLQLLRRDRWRYLLFVDIAWAAAKKRPPEEMTIPSRY